MLRLLMTLVLLFAIVGCGGTKKKKESTSSASTGTTPTVPVDQTPAPKNLFFVNHAFDPLILRYTRFLNPDGTVDFSKKCSVDLDSAVAADKDIQCVVDSMEWDLYLRGMSFDYNVPKTSKCMYLAGLPYYFWQREAKKLPATTISVTLEQNDFVGAVVSDPRVSYNPVSSQVTCDYDYSASGGSDCCEGNYTLTITNDDDGNNGTPALVSTVKGAFPGKVASCLAGPAMSFPLTERGFPMRVVERMEVEVDAEDPTKTNTGNYVVAAPIDNLYLSNMSVANAIDLNPAAPGLHYRLDTAYADPAFAGDGTSAQPRTNPAYEWGCYDEAAELKGRIRVYVREWNTRAAFVDVQNGVVASPNESGAETDFPDQDEEDRFDWVGFFTDNVLNIFPGDKL